MDRVWPVITNTEAIDVNHAWAGQPGTLHKKMGINETIEIWTKPLPVSALILMLLWIPTLPVSALIH
jgi:hypothetical protein